MDSFVNLLCGLPPLSAKSSTRQCPGFSSISPRNMAPGLLFSLAKIILTTPLLVLRHRTHLNDAYWRLCTPSLVWISRGSGEVWKLLSRWISPSETWRSVSWSLLNTSQAWPWLLLHYVACLWWEIQEICHSKSVHRRFKTAGNWHSVRFHWLAIFLQQNLRQNTDPFNHGQVRHSRPIWLPWLLCGYPIKS